MPFISVSKKSICRIVPVTSSSTVEVGSNQS